MTPRPQFASTGRFVLLAGLCLASCRSQLLPGPMRSTVNPLPAGESNLYPEGSEEVVIIRHADPVRVRPAGITSSYPLTFHNKSTRLNSGSAVYSSSGGRIEVLWPNSTSIVLSGEGSGIVGSVSRGEPTFILRDIERATLNLNEGDQVELLGGSLLTASSGPFVLEHSSPEVLRVRNQSKESAEIAFRTDTILLDPGEVVDLPLLTSGGAPAVAPLQMETLDLAGYRARVRGQCEVEEGPDSLSVRGIETTELHTLGVKIHLEPGDTVTVSGLPPTRPQAANIIPAASPDTP